MLLERLGGTLVAGEEGLDEGPRAGEVGKILFGMLAALLGAPLAGFEVGATEEPIPGCVGMTLLIMLLMRLDARLLAMPGRPGDRLVGGVMAGTLGVVGIMDPPHEQAGIVGVCELGL